MPTTSEATSKACNEKGKEQENQYPSPISTTSPNSANMSQSGSTSTPSPNQARRNSFINKFLSDKQGGVSPRRKASIPPGISPSMLPLNAAKAVIVPPLLDLADDNNDTDKNPSQKLVHSGNNVKRANIGLSST